MTYFLHSWNLELERWPASPSEPPVSGRHNTRAPSLQPCDHIWPFTDNKGLKSGPHAWAESAVSCWRISQTQDMVIHLQWVPALFAWETPKGVQCPKAFQICIPDFIVDLTFHIFMATSSPEILFMDLFRVILWISLFHCWVPHSLALEQHPDVPGKVCERRKSKLRSVLDLTDLILQRRVQCILLVQRDYTYETTILHHPQKTLLICT